MWGKEESGRRGRETPTATPWDLTYEERAIRIAKATVRAGLIGSQVTGGRRPARWRRSVVDYYLLDYRVVRCVTWLVAQGWCAKRQAETAEGEPIHHTSDDALRRGLDGAVLRALEREAEPPRGKQGAVCEALWRRVQWGAGLEPEGDSQVGGGRATMRRWNDAPGRTRENVRAALERALRRLEPVGREAKVRWRRT